MITRGCVGYQSSTCLLAPRALVGITFPMTVLSSPPPPPPLPPQPRKSSEPAVKLRSKMSPFIRTLQQTVGGYWFEPEERADPTDVATPRLGSYFCYGTLMDPTLLSEILDLPQKPTLRPALLVSYSPKLWGQYPALIYGPPAAVVKGMVYGVELVEHAQRLVEYETQAYRPKQCLIRFNDGEEPEEVTGTTFEFVGGPLDLSEGAFDLGIWLNRMGRARSGVKAS